MTISTVLLIGALSVQTVPPALSTFLRSQMDFSPSNVQQIGRGEVVTKKLYAESEREIAIVGVTRLPTTKDQVGGALRKRLIEYVRGYLTDGDSALVVYDHKSDPLFSSIPQGVGVG